MKKSSVYLLLHVFVSIYESVVSQCFSQLEIMGAVHPLKTKGEYNGTGSRKKEEERNS